jgi:hypothetical protein
VTSSSWEAMKSVIRWKLEIIESMPDLETLYFEEIHVQQYQIENLGG